MDNGERPWLHGWLVGRSALFCSLCSALADIRDIRGKLQYVRVWPYGLLINPPLDDTVCTVR